MVFKPDVNQSLLPRPTRTVGNGGGGGDAALKTELPRPMRSPFAWPASFYIRRNISYEWENTAWALNNKLEHHLRSPENVMCFILRTDEDSARYEARIRPILDICHDAQPEDLFEGDLQGPCRKMGWIIDGYYRGEEDDPWSMRRTHGALSARDMAKLLLEKRYVSSSADDELEDSEAIDAERRLIYVTDLDQWGILALIMTSPESQARLLGGFLQKHLCARPSIGVSISADGPSIFALDFHVPFHVWRTTDQLLRDPRTKISTGEPLRNSRDMTFLKPSNGHSPTPKTHGLYSGHVAFIITGYDQWRWTAILSIDTWFNTGEGATDKVERYQFDLEDGMQSDPLSGGQDDATKPRWEPRAYFLRIMLLKLGQVADEWELIRLNLEEGLINLSHKKKQLLCRMSCASSEFSRNEHIEELEALETHLANLKETFQELLRDLYETLKIGEGFLSTEVNYFLHDDGSPGDASECYPSLSEIRRNFNEVSQQYAFFVSLKECCDDLISSCETARRKYPIEPRHLENDSRGLGEDHQIGSKFRLVSQRGHHGISARGVLHQHSTHPGLTQMELMSVFLRSPVPYFWVLTSFVTPSTHIISAVAWQRILWFTHLLIPLALIMYSYWLLHTSISGTDSKGRTKTKSTISNENQHFAATSEAKTWLMVKIHRVMGGFGHHGGDQRSLFPSLDLSTPAEEQESPADRNGPSPSQQGQQSNHGVTQYIPICLSDNENCLWKLQQLSSEDCHDDEQLFKSLRSLVKDKSGRTWLGILSSIGFRKPVGMHYVRFALCGGGQVRILSRENNFPPRSNPPSYRPTHEPGSATPKPIESDVLVDHYDNPSRYYTGSRDILDHIVHKLDGPFGGDECRGLGYGLEIEEGPNRGRLGVVRLSMVICSYVLGAIRTLITGETEGSFSIATALAIVCAMSITTLETAISSRFAVSNGSRHNTDMV